jgi:hypothetical protein
VFGKIKKEVLWFASLVLREVIEAFCNVSSQDRAAADFSDAAQHRSW